MTAQLPPSDLMFLRSLKRTAIVLLLIFRLDPQPVGRDDVADLLDIDTKTSAKYLHDLSQHGLITRTGYRDGYVLTAGGRQMVLGMEAKTLPGESGNFPLSKNPALLESGNSPLSQNPVLCEGGNFPPSDANPSSKVEFFHLESGNSPLLETLVVKEDIKSSISLDISTTRENQDGNFPLSLAQVLEIAPALFDGHVVSIHGIEDADPQAALRWIAYAFRTRSKLDRPCGLIYRRLQKHAAPPDDAGIDKLPRTILAKLGLIEPAAEGEDMGNDEINESTELPAPCPALDKRHNGASLSPREAWQSALKELQPEMARAQFDTWVRDTIPIAWQEDPSKQEAILQVASRNPYGRDWLENKLTDLVAPLLCRMLDLTVTVRFVVARVSTETEE